MNAGIKYYVIKIWKMVIISNSFYALTVLTWSIYYISRHPEVQEKVHKEFIDQLGTDGDVTVDNIDKLV